MAGFSAPKAFSRSPDTWTRWPRNIQWEEAHMRRMEDIGHCQIIMATHSPMLMAYPNATLLRLTKYGLEPVKVKDTDHYKVMREFCEDPKGFVDAAIVE
jgi:predicted ATPase